MTKFDCWFPVLFKIHDLLNLKGVFGVLTENI